MNIHKHARLTFVRRIEMVQQLISKKLSVPEAGVAYGVTPPTVRKLTGNRRDTVDGAGWDFVFVAMDDHARVAFTDIHPDERSPSAVRFLRDAVAYYARLGVSIQRLLTDNGSAFRSHAFAAVCRELGIKHRFTRPYRPQTNGKAERFIQSALREWAYARTYQNSQHRADAMKSWLHHYNWHRPHQGIGRAVPVSRLNLDEYNLLTLHTGPIRRSRAPGGIAGMWCAVPSARAGLRRPRCRRLRIAARR